MVYKHKKRLYHNINGRGVFLHYHAVGGDEGDLNPYGLLHKFLRLARLPFRHVPV